MRTDNLEQLEAEAPETHTTNQVRAEQTPPVEPAKTRAPGQIHYGRQHARTAELYRKHREERAERERAEQLRASEAQAEPMRTEAPAPEESQQQAAEPMHPDARKVEEPRQDTAPDEAGRPGLKDLAQQAVSSVLTVAKHAYPFTRARELAGDAFSGVRRVAREVSARTSRSKKNEP